LDGFGGVEYIPKKKLGLDRGILRVGLPSECPLRPCCRCDTGISSILILVIDNLLLCPRNSDVVINMQVLLVGSQEKRLLSSFAQTLLLFLGLAKACSHSPGASTQVFSATRCKERLEDDPEAVKSAETGDLLHMH